MNLGGGRKSSHEQLKNPAAVC